MNFSLNAVADALNDGLSSISSSLNINEQLKNYSPAAVAGITAISLFAFQKLYRGTQPRWNESRLAQCGRLLMHIPYVKAKFKADVGREYARSLQEVLDKWKPFGTPFTKIPEEGFSSEELVKVVEKYSNITFHKLKDKQISGAVYSNNFIKENDWNPFKDMSERMDYDNMSDSEYFTVMSEKLKWVHTYGEYMSDLWNSLHQDEFAVGDFIKYQVVRMVADMFGGKPDEVMGFVTTGGTDSLMTAGRIYRNWGMETRGHRPGEGVIIAPRSVHAAILKSGLSSQCKVVLIDVDEQGTVDLAQFKKAMDKHKKHLTFIVGSAPSYATGKVDQIEKLAALAHEYGVGMHVDCCLGGFIVNNLEQHQTDYLQLKGVTSISCDTHKNGLGPKGSSVLVMKGIGNKDKLENWNLARSSVYSIPGWDGGVYGTPSDAGSEPCTHVLNALLSMLAMGKKGYRRMAKSIHDGAREFAETVGSFEGKLKVLTPPEVNVVAFKMDENSGFEKGAIYAFAHEMKKRGFILNTMPGERVHFCITLRYVSDEQANNNLEQAIWESLEAVEKLNSALAATGAAFPGSAGMYCALGRALEPKRADLSFQKFVENSLLGTQGAREAICAHYLALFDPYRSTSPYAKSN